MGIRLRRFVLFVATALPITSVVAQSAPRAAFTTFGSGCSGSVGIPVLSAEGLPAFGRSFSIRLDRAAATAPAVLYFAPSRGNVTVAGCTVLIDTAGAHGIAAFTDGQGRAVIGIPVPNASDLLGARIPNQWTVFDAGVPRGFSVSNGGEAVVGVEPQLAISSVQGPATGGRGTRVALRGSNFSGDARDYCIRGEDDQGGSVVFVGRSLRDVGNGERELVCELVAAPPAPRRTLVQVMRGRERVTPVPAIAGVLPATGAWAWDGLAYPENLSAGFWFTPSQSLRSGLVFEFQKAPAEEVLTVRFPQLDPFTGAVRWRKGTRLSANFDWSMTCTTPPRAYDGWFESLTLSGSLLGIEVGEAVAGHIAAAFNARFAADLDITTEATLVGAEVVVKVRAPLGCTIDVSPGYGKLTIDEPVPSADRAIAVTQTLFGAAELEVIDATGPLAASALATPLDALATSPDGAMVAVVSSTDPAVLEVFDWSGTPTSRGSITLPVGFTDVRLQVTSVRPGISPLVGIAMSGDQPDRMLGLFLADPAESGSVSPPRIAGDLDFASSGISARLPFALSPDARTVVCAQDLASVSLMRLTGVVFNVDPMDPGAFSALAPVEFPVVTSTFMTQRATALAFNPTGDQLICGNEVGDIHSFRVRADATTGFRLEGGTPLATGSAPGPSAVVFRRDCSAAFVLTNRSTGPNPIHIAELTIDPSSFVTTLSPRAIDLPIVGFLVPAVGFAAVDGGDHLIVGYEHAYRVVDTAGGALSAVVRASGTAGGITAVAVLGR